MTKNAITLLGSTGSIGTQTLDVLQILGAPFQVHALAAGCKLELLAQQIKAFKPKRVCIQNASDIPRLRSLVPQYEGEILHGEDGLLDLAGDAATDTLVVGLTGMRGLAPTLKALKAGKRVLTANKETFVVGGHLVAPYLEQIIPIDSEHCAIHQCLKAEATRHVQRLLLTASGGPFRTLSLDSLKEVTVAQALQHPNWVMGPKVTIDSATLMNKGLEVIEAHWLFGLPFDRIDILIHPQSVVHSGVEFIDGSTLFQLGVPDMRLPIQYALTYPARSPSTVGMAGRLDWRQIQSLDFEMPDFNRFPCAKLAYEAGKAGPSACVALNAADEVAVQLCLENQLPFYQIPSVLQSVLGKLDSSGLVQPQPDLENIIALDAWARRMVMALRSVKETYSLASK